MNNNKGKKRRRPYGAGCVYKRGKTWWINYSVNGVRYNLSAETQDRIQAEKKLREHLQNSQTFQPSEVTGRALRALCGQRATVSRTAIGAASEMLVSADLLTNGFNVYRAVSQHAVCDLIVIIGGQMYRVEVKTGIDGKQIQLSARRKALHDILAVVTRKGGITYNPRLETLGIPPQFPQQLETIVAVDTLTN